MSKIMQNPQFKQKLKFQKTYRNLFYNSFRVALFTKPIEKTPNMREMTLF